MSINVGTKEEKGWAPLGQPSNCLGWSMGGVGLRPLTRRLAEQKRGGGCMATALSHLRQVNCIISHVNTVSSQLTAF